MLRVASSSCMAPLKGASLVVTALFKLLAVPSAIAFVPRVPGHKRVHQQQYPHLNLLLFGTVLQLYRLKEQHDCGGSSSQPTQWCTSGSRLSPNAEVCTCMSLCVMYVPARNALVPPLRKQPAVLSGRCSTGCLELSHPD